MTESQWLKDLRAENARAKARDIARAERERQRRTADAAAERLRAQKKGGK